MADHDVAAMRVEAVQLLLSAGRRIRLHLVRQALPTAISRHVAGIGEATTDEGEDQSERHAEAERAREAGFDRDRSGVERATLTPARPAPIPTPR